MRNRTSIASRLVHIAKRLTLIVGLVATLALPITASASSHSTPAAALHTFRPADGVGDSPLVP